MKDERTVLDVASVGDAEGVAALVGLDAPTDPLATVPAEEQQRILAAADRAANAQPMIAPSVHRDTIRREVAAWHAAHAPLTPSDEAAILAFRAGQAVTRDLLATDAVIVEPIEILKQLPAERVTEEELQEIERFAAQYKAHAGERLGTEAFEGLYSRMLRDMPRLAAEVRALRPAPAADASLEAAERIWRGEWQRIAADIRSMSEAGKTPADILAILLTHLDMMKPLAVVRAVDASRPVMPERPMIDPDFAGVVWTATIKDRTEDDGPIQVGVVRDGDNYQPRFFGLGKWRDPAPDFGYRILVAWALASQPGLTEEARRAFEVACRDAAAKGGPYCITHTREAVAKLDAALLRVSRGETGQAADGITRVCVVEPATIGTGIGGEPIKIRPTGLTSFMADAQQRPSVPPASPFGEWPEPEHDGDPQKTATLAGGGTGND